MTTIEQEMKMEDDSQDSLLYVKPSSEPLDQKSEEDSLRSTASDRFSLKRELPAVGELQQLLFQYADDDFCGFCESNDQLEKADTTVKIVSTGCNHQVHAECLTKYAFDKQMNGEEPLCPECDNRISPSEYNQYLTEEQKEQIDKAMVDQMLKNCPGLSRCPCGNVMEVVPGKLDLWAKDDKGNVMKLFHKLHMKDNRVRCRECEESFCKGCGSQPYHLGKNCEEFEKHKTSVNCRFCDEEVTTAYGPKAFRNICSSQECLELKAQCCDKVHECGHSCAGFRGEEVCLPCLQPECVAKAQAEGTNELLEGVDADSYCSICWLSGLGAQACVKLGCGHVFHKDCVQKIFDKKWVTPRMQFNFLNCPSCKQLIDCDHCPSLKSSFDNARVIQAELKEKAMMRAKHEGLDKSARLSQVGDQFYNDLEGLALQKLAYYMCFKCKKPYFGGMRDCEQNAQEEQDFREQDLMCAGCSSELCGSGVAKCDKHGTDFIDFKCMWCCSTALWFCEGKVHYCDRCHNEAIARKRHVRPCPGTDKCPLRIDHPANGTTFALGCSLCRENKINQKQF